MYVNNIFHTGNLYKTFDSLMKFLKGYEKNLKQYIGHGDLCFNNILVDQISGCIKLIDPKAYWDKKINLFGTKEEYIQRNLKRLNLHLKLL